MKKAFVFGLVLGTLIWILEPTVINFLESVVDAIDDHRIMAAREPHSAADYQAAAHNTGYAPWHNTIGTITTEDLFYWHNTIA